MCISDAVRLILLGLFRHLYDAIEGARQNYLISPDGVWRRKEGMLGLDLKVQLLYLTTLLRASRWPPRTCRRIQRSLNGAGNSR